MCIKCEIIDAIKHAESFQNRQGESGDVGTESLLTVDDKYQIQQAVLACASQNYAVDLVEHAKNICAAVTAIKVYPHTPTKIEGRSGADIHLDFTGRP